MSAHKSTRVLILDDGPVIVDTLCMVLKQCGFEALGVYGFCTRGCAPISASRLPNRLHEWP